MSVSRSCLSHLLLAGVLLVGSEHGFAQDRAADQSWTSSNQQESPDQNLNPTRTTESHAGSGDRNTDKTSVERLGPDGRYVPYSDVEKESVRVNETTVRTIERTYGRDADGRRTLIQQSEEETRSLPGGAQQMSRTVSNPDGDGKLQVVRRELEDSKPVSAGVTVTTTTLSMPDGDGGFSAAVRTEQREVRSEDGTVQSRKSTLITDGTGGWKLSEVRESVSRPDSSDARTKEERVSRPDGEGKLAEVERTVSKESGNSADKRTTVEKYSTDVPGVAGDNGLQLVQRETTLQRASDGTQSTARQTEKVGAASPSDGLRLTDETIDIVRPNASGTANQSLTILSTDSDGRMTQVWVDTGKTEDPAATKADTKAAAKPATNAK